MTMRKERERREDIRTLNNLFDKALNVATEMSIIPVFRQS